MDDSLTASARSVAESFAWQFESAGCELRYFLAPGQGVNLSKNVGVDHARGDAILFLDDDTLLERDCVGALAGFLATNPKALGVQPKLVQSNAGGPWSPPTTTFRNAVSKCLMLSYCEDNRSAMRRSGKSVLPRSITRVASAQVLSGSSCYRRAIFDAFRFDVNLKGYGFLEDFAFSYRVQKMHPSSLYLMPCAVVVHKSSTVARLPAKSLIYMRTINWFYVFFNDVFDNSALNLIAFLWAILGEVLAMTARLVLGPSLGWGPKQLTYLLRSIILAIRHSKEIAERKLGFWDR
jgi:GT2 family glycosyltransferase